MIRPALFCFVVLTFLGCSSSTSTTITTSSSSAASTTTTSGTTSTGTTTTAASTSTTDLTKLPMGDGKYTTSPTVGYIYSCQTTFNSNAGASANGPWINTSTNTFDYTAKLHVSGSVSWPNALFTITLNGNTRTVTGNDLPINHTTGTFPIASSDPASAYDRNPNSILVQALVYSLPANPTASASPSCLSMGPVGVLLSGVELFNALDAQGRDAVAHETQDNCDGHPQEAGAYHYHNLSDCIADPGTGHSALIGYAFDGFGIYGSRGESGQQLTNADLDACHGHIHTITWDGQSVSMYHYHATREYPYTIGCYHGTPVSGRMALVPRPTSPLPALHAHHHDHS